jgi:hypothetical protein
MESVVVIPENYEALSQAQGKRIIPICIKACDEDGSPIATEWFSLGVAPVHAELVGMAHHQLGDPWCGSNLGHFPARRVLKKAMWVSEELKYGDWHRIRYLYLAIEELDMKMRDAMLPDPGEYPALFEQKIMLDSVEDRLELEGRTQIRAMFQLMRRGYRWHEIAERLGIRTGEIAKRRFYRWLRKSGA